MTSRDVILFSSVSAALSVVSDAESYEVKIELEDVLPEQPVSASIAESTAEIPALRIKLISILLPPYRHEKHVENDYINILAQNAHKFKYYVDIFWHNRLSENIIIRFGQIRRLMQKNNRY